jgi:hypothetical protein
VGFDMKSSRGRDHVRSRAKCTNPTTASGPRPDITTIKHANAIFMGLGAAGGHDCSFVTIRQPSVGSFVTISPSPVGRRYLFLILLLILILFKTFRFRGQASVASFVEFCVGVFM